jgi:hypothetical protein
MTYPAFQLAAFLLSVSLHSSRGPWPYARFSLSDVMDKEDKQDISEILDKIKKIIFSFKKM